jgi:hypothetical protein
MSLGEKILVVLILLVFAGGIILGVRLYRWNKRDMKRIKEINEAKKSDKERT